jgi:hypothetical protein
MLLTANPRRIPTDLRIPPHVHRMYVCTSRLADCHDGYVRLCAWIATCGSRAEDTTSGTDTAAVPRRSLRAGPWTLQPSPWVNNAKHMRYLHSIQTSAAIPDYYRALTSSATVFTDTARLIAFRSRCPLQGSKLTRCAAAPWPLSAIC